MRTRRSTVVPAAALDPANRAIQKKLDELKTKE